MIKLYRLILVFFFLTSCSYRETILRKAPDFLSDKIEDYLKLNDKQEQELRSRVTSSFFKHHKEVVALRKILADFDVKKDSLRKQIIVGYPPYARVLKDVNAISIDVLSKLSFEQRKELIVKRSEVQEERSKEGSNGLLKRGVKRLSNIFGELSKEQVDHVKELVVAYKKVKLNTSRGAWGKTFVKTLKIKEQNKYIAALKANFSDVQSAKQVIADNEYFFKFFNKFQKTLSKDQIAKFNSKRKEILAWIDLYLKIYQTPTDRT